VGRFLETDAASIEVPEAVREGLSERVRQTRRDNLVLLDQLRRLGDELDAAGIEFALLKGAAVLPFLYDGPHERPLADVDLLVRAGDWPVVRSHLERCGRYELPLPHQERLRLDSHRKTEVATRQQPRCVFEFHVDIDIRGRAKFEVDALLDRAVPVSLEGRMYRRLADPDLALHLVLHTAQHASTPRLIWIHDLARLAASGRIDWGRLRDDGMQARSGACLYFALTYLEKVYPGTVAETLLDELSRGWLRRRIFRAYATPNPIQPTTDLWTGMQRYVIALALLDSPGRMIRFLVSHGYRKLRRRVTGRRMNRVGPHGIA
jgi:hypothetical protein